ncbi:S-adenosylmethionine-diacylgycerolhomoserine-N-methyltransferase [Methylohalomonas lacus]|uniref:S-adenosylmethionine-diacylgycerolhomoserine-N-methyltransferase n=1 Tax=Methylohalomonas lacus TaxID=398773 RepID=A0AAE3HIF5_9GAMM|nr:class I SAM-dependent methyltransferase [Methylohalomonas lacus]MCS3902465.1 S-adenosylmethionine-diacylgycerolhomoserine-N-methyltransferase [Methylohalomonas lacus]
MKRSTTIGSNIENYYRLHAGVYDRSRWAFLFGRRAIVRLAGEHVRPSRVLEVGCGTGYNLELLQQLFPHAELHGLDLSADMLGIARRRLGDRVRLWQHRYDRPITACHQQPGYDLILASYALSMFNPGWVAAIDAMRQDLAPGGSIAVVDFHDSRSRLFRDWMAMNHVRMEGHLLVHLQQRLQQQALQMRSAYAGLWRYCLYIGNSS